MMTDELQNIKKAATNYSIEAHLKTRWSPRVFDSKEIPEKELNQLFEAARWASSSFNRQPWRYLYAHKGSKSYDKIVDCLSDFNKGWATNAPVLLLTAYKEKTEDGTLNFHALHDLGLSVGNMVHQAESMGIAAHQMAGIDWKKAQKVFNVPNGFHITTSIAIGYYGGNPDSLSDDLKEQELAKRVRKPQSEFAFKESWGD